MWLCKGSLSSRRALIKSIGQKKTWPFLIPVQEQTAQQSKCSGGFQSGLDTNMQLTIEDATSGERSQATEQSPDIMIED